MKHGLRFLLTVALSVILLVSLACGIACNQTVTVSFDTDGGEAVVPVKIKTNSAIGKLPAARKDGCVFVGWSDVKGGSVNVDENYIVSKNITLYAVDKNEYGTVKFVTDGTKVQDITVKTGERLGSLPFTDKQGHSFAGWFYGKDGTDKAYSDDIVEGDLTLYAVFEKTDVESVLPDFTEVSLDTDKADYAFNVFSEQTLNESNIDDFVSVGAVYGNLPKIAVAEAGENKYTLSPIGGYQNGGVYKITLNDERVTFADIDVSNGDDYTDERTIKTIYLSVETGDEEVVNLKSNVCQIRRSAVTFSDEGNYFTLSETLFGKLPLDEGAIVRFTDDDADNELFIKVVSHTEADGIVSVYFDEDCEADDVYENFEVNVGEVTAVNEKTLEENKNDTDESLQAMVDSLYASQGTRALTAMLAGALNSSPTLRETVNSASGYKDKISDVQGLAITVDGLLEGLKITARLGSALNPNFNGISIPAYNRDRWTMLSITFSYEGDIKDNVKIEAEITVNQYIYVWLSANCSSKTGDFKVEVTPYSQTDIEFKVLVCSASKSEGDNKKDDKKDDKKEEKKDISVEIENLTNGTGDSSTIIKDVQDMLQNKGGEIQLCEVPMFSMSYLLGGVVSINFDLNFVVKVSFAAGVKIEATLLEATTIGVTGNYKTKTIDCYRRAAKGSDRYIFDFYAYGYLGVKAGLEGELTVSFAGLKKALRAGVGVEVGAYADLYGYLHYHAEERRVFKDIDTNGRHFQSLDGGMYFETGIYLELKAFVGVGSKEYGISKEFKFKLLEAGSKYLYVERAENEDLKIVFNENDKNEISLENIIPAEGKYMDITTGEIEKRVIPAKNLKLISDTNLFKVDNDKKTLTADMDKINARLPYGIPSGKMTLYYKGANILFSSDYLEESVPELKGFKELCEITVYYLPADVTIDDDSDIGKEVTLNYVVSYKDGDETVDYTVKTEKVIAGQYVRGGVPDEVIEYCHLNGLLTEQDGTAVTYDGLKSGKQTVTASATYTFRTAKAQRFIAVQYLSNYEQKQYTVEIYALEYDGLPQLTDTHKNAPKNVYAEFYAVTLDGDSHVAGNEYLSKYDLYMRGTHGYETGKVLASKTGTKDEIDQVFADLKNGTGAFAEYAEYFTYTLKAEYITGMHQVYFYDAHGNYAKENVKYGESFKVPDYWIANIDNDGAKRLVGWDTDGDGKTDILPNERFTVTTDMVLRPVTTGKGYVLTVVRDGTATEYTLEAGSKIPQSILDVINSAPATPTQTDEGSFYSDGYRTVTTTDFVEGDDSTAYFKGLAWRYNGDITTMPACDITFREVAGKLYHYVTIVDKTNGHFTYKNDNGEVVEAKTVTVAVEDGGNVAYSDDYIAKEVKYHAPANVSYYLPSYTSDSGDVLDIYGSAITKAETYRLTTWERYDGTYSVLFEYCLNTDGDVSCEVRRKVAGITDTTKLEELIALCDADYQRLTSSEYCDSLSDERYNCSVDAEMGLDGVSYTDGYGITYITYRVYIRKTTRRFTLLFDFDAKNYVNYTNTYKYGEAEVAIDGIVKREEGELNGSKYTDEYRLVGYDIDGDGIVDIKAGEFFVVTKDMTLKAIYEEPTRIWG